MLLDFEVQRCTRECAATGRKLEPGEAFYSVLEAEGADVVRRDFAVDAWQAPPEGIIAWWQSRVPQPNCTKVKLAPNDVLLELFEQLADQPGSADLRYVLALLLVRRRVLRLEDADDTPEMSGAAGPQETLSVYCPRRDESYAVTARTPSDERIDEIQQHLAGLLYADAK